MDLFFVCYFLFFSFLGILKLGMPEALFLAIVWLVCLRTRSTGQTILDLLQLISSSATGLKIHSSVTARVYFLAPCYPPSAESVLNKLPSL